MKANSINGLTFEMAQTMVNGTKYKTFHQFKKYAIPSFGEDDIKSIIDEAIFKAWKEWDPEKSKFNTYATNMITWLLNRARDTHHPYFRTKFKTKNNLNAQGESFTQLKNTKVTKSEEFNQAYNLNGENEITKDIYEKYVTFKAEEFYGVINIINQCELINNDEDNREITDTNNDTIVEEGISDIEMVEMIKDTNNLSNTKKIIAGMLIDGHGIDVIAKKMGISKFKLTRDYGGFDMKPSNQTVTL